MVAEIRPEPFDPEWKGGYFCPCHKSRFDMSGRVFDGVPAPINLLVPPHHYRDDSTIIIGVDPQGSLIMANILTRTATGVADWVNARAPGLMPVYRKHVSEYYAPKTSTSGTTSVRWRC